MSERELLLSSVEDAPKSTDISLLVKLMEAWGFDHRTTSSNDNILFWHKVYEVRASAARPHHGPVLVTYVRKCLRAIEEIQIREAQSDD